LSVGTRRQFYWPEPGARRSDEDAFDVAGSDLRRIPSTFCLCLVEPRRVCYLDLNQRPFLRARFLRSQDGRWVVEELNP
jgi:hypothetical protein